MSNEEEDGHEGAALVEPTIGEEAMAEDIGFVSTAKPLKATGAVYSAPVDTTAPDDATTPLGNGFANLGRVGEEGVTNTVKTDNEGIKDWSGDTVLTTRTSRDETFKLTMISTNAAVLKEVYGQGNVTEEGNGLTVIHNNVALPARMWVFEMLLAENRMKRVVLPNATITEVGDVEYKAGAPIGYEVTLSCAPDDDGTTAVEYIADIVTD